MSAPCTSRLLLAAPACLLLTVGCADETTGAGDSPSTAVSEAGPGATAGASTAARTPADVGWFRDATAAAGLPTERPMTDAEPRAIVEVKGGGLALFDFEGDGDLDMYDPGQGSFEAPAASALHVNLSTEEGRLAFKPGTLMPGDYPAWPMGLAVGDLDGDGYQDLYQTAHGPNAALWSTSTNVVRALGPRNTPTGLEHDGFGMAAALGDLDNDGDLDVYLVNYLELDLDDLPPDIEFLGEPIFAGPMGLTPEADAVFENLGDGTFKDKTFRSGIGVAPPSYGLGVTMLDLDADGDLDVFVGIDSMRNFVYENEGGFRFAERGMELGLAANGDGREQATMGISATDLNDDGVADLVVVLRDVSGALIPTVAHVFAGPLEGTSGPSAAMARVEVSDSLFERVTASAAGDLNGDGFLDLVVSDEQRAAGRGRVSVLYGPLTGERDLADAEVVVDGEHGACEFGLDEADHVGKTVLVGDGDGDGIDDLWMAMEPLNEPERGCTYRGHRSTVGVLRGGRG